MSDYPLDPTADATFERLAADALDDILAMDPVAATALGDHRFDDRLPDLSAAGREEARSTVAGWLSAVDAVDDLGLCPDNAVDLELLRSALSARLFDHDHLREHTWNPLLANPGSSIYVLLARDFAPLGDRLRSVAGRLAGVPELLARARSGLGRMPRVHVETALLQLAGTRDLIEQEVGGALVAEPRLRAEVERVQQSALEAVDDHLAWLEAALPGADRDPRLGAELYAGRLWHTLDTETAPDTVLVRAESDLMRVEAEIAEIAAGRDVRAVYDALADDGPVDDTTILEVCREALEQSTAFVREHDLVTVPEPWDDLVEIIVMPEIHRGRAVAYCDPPGPFEPARLPTFFAVSPTPVAWPPDRVRSFYREYNAHQLRSMTVHEAMPGHALQLAHARADVGRTRVRQAFWSGPFVEGWAVYAEDVMARLGFGGEAVRLQQLKMQLRMTINAILDVRVHAHGMTEPEAMALMTQRGHQELGEAAGKWRRAQLTSAQLSTYYVGFVEVSELSHELAASRRQWSLRERHDAMLAHGSPPPRHLRTLLAAVDD